jgi:hypothetical protein
MGIALEAPSMHTARLEEEDTPASMTTASIRTMPLAARARRGPAGGCLFPDGQRIKVFGKIIHAVDGLQHKRLGGTNTRVMVGDISRQFLNLYSWLRQRGKSPAAQPS